jgi:hypothetical protein
MAEIRVLSVTRHKGELILLFRLMTGAGRTHKPVGLLTRDTVDGILPLFRIHQEIQMQAMLLPEGRFHHNHELLIHSNPATIV